MFEVVVKKNIRATHALRNYQGREEDLHAHEWLIEVRLQAEKLDQSGCAIDFVKVDQVLFEILNPFEDKSLNQNSFFNQVSPSAENFAIFLYNKLKSFFAQEQPCLTSVSVWEDNLHGTTYKE